MGQPRNTAVAARQLTTASDADLVSLARQESAAAFSAIMARASVHSGIEDTTSKAEAPCLRVFRRAYVPNAVEGGAEQLGI